MIHIARSKSAQLILNNLSVGKLVLKFKCAEIQVVLYSDTFYIHNRDQKSRNEASIITRDNKEF